MSEPDLCVVRVPIFQGLTRAEQETVAEVVRPLRVARGETVHLPGQPVTRVLVVHSGRLKVSQTSANGHEQVLRTAGAGEVVGERAFLTGQRSEDLVVAIEDSQMCALDHDDLSALLGRYPDITQRILRTLSDRLHSTERLLAAVTSSDVGARVAAYLLDLPVSVRDSVVAVRLPMAKQDVAGYLGTTPETLSRRLAALSDRGIIRLQGRRDVELLDIDALEEVAEPG
ncbi:Crp/Fnr family transcriptional regulator [Georgenia sp. Z1344]|uniref:Crp/Fnr family transcriptional regulator n=1 Tax=Georgenia sp. Z1344 TaxID=3416706 RepID=UPI003CEC5585